MMEFNSTMVVEINALGAMQGRRRMEDLRDNVAKGEALARLSAA